MSDSEEEYEYEYDDSDVDSNDGSGSAEDMSLDAASQEGMDEEKDDDGDRKMSANPNEPPSGGFDQAACRGIRTVSASTLRPVMDELIMEVAEVLGVPSSAATVLMRDHRWAKERLFSSFFDNPDKVQKKCGVASRCSCQGDRKLPPRSGKVTCNICFDDIDPKEMIQMPCGHEFCETCWYGFLYTSLEKGPACVLETCPQQGCTEVITEEVVARAAPDQLPKFQSYQLRSFVDTYSLTRWCPGPGCESIALAPQNKELDDIPVTKCDTCSTEFCIKCGDEPHAPITCKSLARWAEKCRNESETANWILANTKPCPKCNTRIEKNQGCNHMTCCKCRYEFCWICMGNWADHGANTGGYYKCNKFDPQNDGDQSDAAKAKRELDRYLHYYKRYHAHSQACDFARKSVKETEARMVLLQEQNTDSTWTDVEFLKTANEQLVVCRRVLKYTYAFAFYLADVQKRERFEYHQEMLERFTENLSELSEKPLREMNRTEVVNQTRVVDKFMKAILKYVDDGLGGAEDGAW